MAVSKAEIARRAGIRGGAVTAQTIEDAKSTLIKYVNNIRKPAFTKPAPIASRLSNYIAKCKSEGRPLTETGLRVALGIDLETYQNYKAGERDYLTALDIESRDGDTIQELINEDAETIYQYLMDSNGSEICAPTLSNVIQKARDLISLEREERLATSGRVAEIFTMKAREGWQDGSEHVTNVLNVSTANATEALRLLGFTAKDTD